MTFLWEELLWLFLAVPALVALYVVLLARRASQAFSYPGIDLFADALDARYRWRTHVPAALVLAAICAFLAASARPIVVDDAHAGPRKLVVAIDVSYSMAADDVAPTRLAFAKEIASAVVRWQPQDVEVGIVAFGAQANLVQAPTSQRRRVLERIASLELEAGTGLGTGLLASLMTVFPHAAFAGGYDVFGREAPGWTHAGVQPGASASPSVARRGTARVLLLSDGYSTGGVPSEVAIDEAAARQVPVYTVGIGTLSGHISEQPATPAGFDERTLQAMARHTGGRYWNGAKMADRAALVASVEKALRYAPRSEIGVYLSGLGGLLLLAAVGLSCRARPRLQPYR